MRLFFTASLLYILSIVPALAQVVDASFAPTSLLVPGYIRCVAQQADGKYLALGAIKRTDTAPAPPLVRFNADFTLDQDFLKAVATLQGNLYAVHPLPTGKILLVGDGALTLAGVTRQDLLRLNADGSPDASFDAGKASGTGQVLVVRSLTNGQLLVGGDFATYNSLPYKYLVRLNADGGIDNSLSAAAIPGAVFDLAVLPSGKILAGGADALGLRRLNNDGSFDTSFGAPAIKYVANIAVQPDGKMLVGGVLKSNPLSSRLVRLLADGSQDLSFVAGASGIFDYFYYSPEIRRLLLQPDGSVLIVNNNPGLVRLNANGLLDASFQSPITARATTYWLASTSQGQVLLGGAGFELNAHRSNLALLNANGSVDAGLAPTLLTSGTISGVAEQPDGKLLALGSFDEVNGQRFNNLVRLNTDGSPDASFVAPTWLHSGKLLVLPNGKILVTQYTPGSQPALLQLLPNGSLDTNFLVRTPIRYISQCLRQPDGRLIVVADTSLPNQGGKALPIRLLADGHRDSSFKTTFNINYEDIYDAALQADGKLVITGSFYNANVKSVMRLLANGQHDPTFTEPAAADVSQDAVLAMQPDGKLLVEDPSFSALLRLTANGQFDNTFAAAQPLPGEVYALQVQPSGRILAAGSRFLSRVLADGTIDPAFTSPSLNGLVYSIALTPTGQIVVGGSFTTVNNQARTGLARFTDGNALATAPLAATRPGEAYPNPVHGLLHLALDATAQLQRVTLSTLLGQPVRTQSTFTSTPALDTSGLPVGTYLLQIDYASSRVTRRITIE